MTTQSSSLIMMKSGPPPVIPLVVDIIVHALIIAIRKVAIVLERIAIAVERIAIVVEIVVSSPIEKSVSKIFFRLIIPAVRPSVITFVEEHKRFLIGRRERLPIFLVIFVERYSSLFLTFKARKVANQREDFRQAFILCGELKKVVTLWRFLIAQGIAVP